MRRGAVEGRGVTVPDCAAALGVPAEGRAVGACQQLVGAR